MLCVSRLLRDNPNFKFQFRGDMEFKNVSKPVPCYWLLEHSSHVVQDPVLETALPGLPVPLPPPPPVTGVFTCHFHNILMFCYFVILLYTLLTFCEHYIY